MKTIRKFHWLRSLIATIILILLVLVATIWTNVQLHHMEESFSFDTLSQEADQIGYTLETQFEDDQQQLKLTAAIAAQISNFERERLWELLESYHDIGLISRIEILLPDGRVIGNGRQYIPSDSSISFSEIAGKGVHISDREIDPATGTYIIRHYVPIIQNSETVAILMGIVDLERVPQLLPNTSYGTGISVYLIDGSSGDFLIDTWHDGPSGNIWALGERKMAAGYDPKTMKEGLIKGEKNYVVFISETTNEYLYFYYQPLSIYQWRIAISVPEEVVFTRSNQVVSVWNAFMAFLTVCLILYLAWTLHYVYRETLEKQRQLDAVHSLYDVEKMLFTAHLNKENLRKAMQAVAKMASAEIIGLRLFGKEEMGILWHHSNPDILQENYAGRADSTRWLLQYFKDGHSIYEGYTSADIQRILPGGKNTRNLIVLPIEDLDGGICGIFAACNLVQRAETAGLLKGIAPSFALFARNISSYNEVKAQGERDVLSGMFNRNRYEMDLTNYRHWFTKSLACINMDINNLHEVNNLQGHKFGDQIIRESAAAILHQFGQSHSYRIGGDEFVSFYADTPEATIRQLADALKSSLEQKGIYISVGVQWAADIPVIDGLVQEAEKKMYADKTDFYTSRRWKIRTEFDSTAQ